MFISNLPTIQFAQYVIEYYKNNIHLFGKRN